MRRLKECSSPTDSGIATDVVATMSAGNPQIKHVKFLVLSLLLVSIALHNILLGTSIQHTGDGGGDRSATVALPHHDYAAVVTTSPVGRTEWSYLQCDFNQPYPRPKHTCTTNSAIHISYCHMESVSIAVDEVKVSMGNESVSSVIGRTDEEELPVYDPSTFSVPRPIKMKGGFERGEGEIFYLENVLQATTVHRDVSPLQCTLNISGPVLLITRYEYCNLYHTMTDWFNAFYALPDPAAKATVLFLDGHAQGALDPVWTQVFGPTYFIKSSFPSGTRLCLDDATFVPAGYASPLWKRRRTFPSHYSPCPEMMDAFVHRVLAAYGVLETNMIPGRVTIVGRKPYMAHPRSNPNRMDRTVSNLADLAAKFEDSHIVYFETMSIREQLQTIRETDVLIANHGAALTHLLFLHDGTTVMEYVRGGTNMFDDMSAWKPRVKRIRLPDLRNSPIEPNVIEETTIEAKKVMHTSIL